MRVMDEQFRLISHVHDLDAPIRTLPHSLLPLLAKPNRLPLLQVDPIRLFLADEVERAIVVDVSVLEDLDERATAVRSCGSQHPRQMTAIRVDRARDERRFRADGE